MEKLIDLTSLKQGLEKLRNDADNGNSHWSQTFEDASDDSQSEMEGYQWAINDVFELINELQEQQNI
jgi:hypothetical protein